MAEREAEEPDTATEAAIRDAKKCHDQYLKCVKDNPSPAGRALCMMKYIACLLKGQMENIDSLGDEWGDSPKSK